MKSHELRLQHFDVDETPSFWETVEYAGDYEACKTRVTELGKTAGFPNGKFLLSNAGYTIVDLKEEADEKKKKAGVELHDALLALYEWSCKVNAGDEGDQAQQLAKKALILANPEYEL